MARYIDADKLLAELQEEIEFKTSMYTEEQNQYFSAGLKCAYRDVKSQPTADVAPIADTVRKMHSEIKERCIKGGIYPAFVASTIDQIEKEMLEGDTE